ncbi:MAG: hypothetical protein IJH53_08230 [Oscillospiraceae bacterium]|nr:hypothetical protein [Oscillospiraceae bacterium]
MVYNNKKLLLSVLWILAGAALLVLSITEVLKEAVYAGMGGALVAVGVLQVVRNLRYRKDEEYKEKVDTEVNDERMSFLRMKSWSWTGYLMILIEGIGVIVALVLGQRTIQLVLSYSVCLILVIYWISYLVLSRKY